MSKVICYVPALITNKQQQKMTDIAVKSIKSKEHDLTTEINTEKYETAVAGAWNFFFDKYRGKEYDCLVVIANDTIADPNAIDFMVKCAQEHDGGMVTGKVDRDLKSFKASAGKVKYTSELTRGLLDPACFVLKKGVIEEIGRVDEQFPGPFVERDLIYRIKLAGFNVVQPDVVLWHHPSHAGTIGNDVEVLNSALRKYVIKWGGDANRERYIYPMNDMSLNYTYCRL